MSDEINDDITEPVPTPRPAGSTDLELLRSENEINRFKASMKAISAERNNLKTQLAALQKEVEELRPWKQKAEEVEQAFTSYKQDSTARLSLAEMGITSERARRALLREYREDTADTPEAERPTLTDWANEVRKDPFFSRLFPAQQEEQEEVSEPAGEERKPDKPAAKRPPPKGSDGDPNGATKPPAGGGAKTIDQDEWRRQRAQGATRGESLKSKIQQLKDQGLIG